MTKKIVLEIWTCPQCQNDCEWSKGTILSICKCGGRMVNTHASRSLDISESEDSKYVDFDPKMKFGESAGFRGNEGLQKGKG